MPDITNSQELLIIDIVYLKTAVILIQMLILSPDVIYQKRSINVEGNPTL